MEGAMVGREVPRRMNREVQAGPRRSDDPSNVPRLAWPLFTAGSREQ